MWYLHEVLKQKSQSPVLDEAEFAEHCLKRLAKAEKHDPRENKPSWFEVYMNTYSCAKEEWKVEYLSLLPAAFLSDESVGAFAKNAGVYNDTACRTHQREH